MLHIDKNKIYQRYLKRIFDFCFALILLIIAFPCILICALIIRIEDSSASVIFRQSRPGKNCKIFQIFKLRTMRVDTQKNGVNLTDQQRLLKSGEIIRKLSLDELPQIFNILKGEMSFIGPRPLLVSYLDFYTLEEIRRHNVLPGITGMAQINGRNCASWEQRFNHDVFYVDNSSLKLDINILMNTFYKVLFCKNVDAKCQYKTSNFNVYRELNFRENEFNVGIK
jgi:lipopolysaccharide/colanic/teichoic acid biosynthesis glycosyltransferase